MLLAIDAGNTNTVFAIYDGERLRGSWRAATEIKRTADEYAVWLTQLMQLEELQRQDITAAILSSVVPEAVFNLITLCTKYFKTRPLVVGEPNCDLGMRAIIDRPEEAGADRLVNAVAAHNRYGGPLVVVDFGTATTFDLVDAEGNFRGGVIVPGINLSLQALYMAAAKLPRVAIRRTTRVVATNTVEAMQSGVYWGYVAMIEGVVARIRQERQESDPGLKVVATGGLAPMFAQATDVIDHSDADLTLHGLLLIHKRNVT
ncbi:MAG: type III pantothenate kinase [Alphaproteobacteria bacterium]|nr:type III pantothenate kinase [Alphaproteobacteria bacterium]TAD87725.1 MAG: type III pantothenate kinase [Alphaproteobacteria bacterium]